MRADIRASGETAVLSDDDLAEFGILTPGVVIGGRFEIVRLIGRGGWATVYEANDRELGERVALKLLRPETAAKARDAIDRLREEIKLARRITHPNVVRIHDLGQADGLTFVTMELVEGVTVRRLLQARRQLGVASTLAIAGPLVSALEAAHRNGVIHRDIKPENIMLDAAGVVKVMDFGIARLVEKKGLDHQLRIYAALRDAGVPFAARIVGDVVNIRGAGGSAHLVSRMCVNKRFFSADSYGAGGFMVG